MNATAPVVDREAALALLFGAATADPQGRAGVAARLGVSRPLISRVLSPNDGTPISQKLAIRVVQTYGAVVCPATGRQAEAGDCARAAGAPPTHNPAAVRLWRHCQDCPFRPLKEEN
jgi:hypothetical protein